VVSPAQLTLYPGQVESFLTALYLYVLQKTDKFKMHKFHHIEYWCPDATNAFKRYSRSLLPNLHIGNLPYWPHPGDYFAYRFSWGLGMPLVAKSDHSTGNSSFASYVLKSDDLTFIFTAPYSRQAAPADSTPAVPSYNQDAIYSFVNKHGLAVRAVGTDIAHTMQILLYSSCWC